MVALTVAVTLRTARRPGGVGLRDAAFGALVAAFPNAGFMGVPLLVALFGDAAAGPVIGAIVIDLVVTSTLCLALAQAESARSAGDAERRAAHAALIALRGALTNPLPWAIVLGAGSAALGPGAARADRPDRAHARRLGHPGGAVHDRRGAVSRRQPCALAHPGRPLPAGGADQALRPPGADLRHRPPGARPSARRCRPSA
jgi:hypothetical protein